MVAYGYIIMRKGWISISWPHSFQTYSEWIDFEPVWIIYEIAGNYISDYRIQVEFHSSQPMNFLSNTDPPSIPDFYFKSKKQNQEKTTEKIKLYVNISHAYVAESVDMFFIVFTRSQVKLLQLGSFLSSGIIIDQWGALFRLWNSPTFFRSNFKPTPSLT